MDFDRVILGIDPGTNVTGYGAIGIIRNEPQVISLGVIDLKKYDDHYLKLKHIFERTIAMRGFLVNSLITRHTCGASSTFTPICESAA